MSESPFLIFPELVPARPPIREPNPAAAVKAPIPRAAAPSFLPDTLFIFLNIANIF